MQVSDATSEPTIQEPLQLKQLFQEYYARLVYFSYQITGDKEGAEDIAQEAFIAYWNQKEEVALQQAAIKSFLYSTAKNASLNVVRHAKVVARHKAQPAAAAADESNMMHTIIKSEVLAEVQKAIESLPESCRKISRMGYLEGMKNQEIAVELGISINTVKTQKKRALQLLRLKLKPGMFFLLLFLLTR